MSGPQPLPSGAPNQAPRAGSGGQPAMQARSMPAATVATGPSPVATSAAPAARLSTPQNLIQIVLEYLTQKGYSRTEAMLRRESQHHDSEGRPVHQRMEDAGGPRFEAAFSMMKRWIDDCLEIYKPEFQRLLWPIFVYCYIQMISEYFFRDADLFFEKNKVLFSAERETDIHELRGMNLPEHIEMNQTAKVYKDNKYRLRISTLAFTNLIVFLESKEKEGGTVILNIIERSMHLIVVERVDLGEQRTLAALIAGINEDEEVPGDDEGIPGHHPGSANTDPNAAQVLPRLTLGRYPMEAELFEDVQAELQEMDEKEPRPGRKSLVQTLDDKLKLGPNEEAPNPDNVPLPPSLLRDVKIEVQKVRDQRDRFKIVQRKGDLVPKISVAMFTFHNTCDNINCLDFSGDSKLIAAGTAESYIRVWTLEGRPMTSVIQTVPGPPDDPTAASRLFIGHSGPVYAVQFSPSIASEDKKENLTESRYLISCSADKTIRLWSLELWTCVVVYKGHVDPVWDVAWGPFGHYFASGSYDRTARLWATDHIAALRIFAGHDEDIDHVSFHPNGAYVFTASCDKTIRMWDVIRGNAVRMFTGHTGIPTALVCSPNGRTLATADDQGAILLWDLSTGRRVKRMRGHGKHGIWSLDWSAESSLLVSGGADCTVRAWDPQPRSAMAEANAAGAGATSAPTPTAATAAAAGAASTAAGTSVINSATGAGTTNAANSEGPAAANAAGNNNAATSITPGIATDDTIGGTARAATSVTGPGATASALAAASAAAAAAGGKKGKGIKEEVVSPDQINVFLTKKTPVYKLKFTSMGLLLGGGAYLP